MKQKFAIFDQIWSFYDNFLISMKNANLSNFNNECLSLFFYYCLVPKLVHILRVSQNLIIFFLTFVFWPLFGYFNYLGQKKSCGQALTQNALQLIKYQNLMV